MRVFCDSCAELRPSVMDSLKGCGVVLLLGVAALLSLPAESAALVERAQRSQRTARITLSDLPATATAAATTAAATASTSTAAPCHGDCTSPQPPQDARQAPLAAHVPNVPPSPAPRTQLQHAADAPAPERVDGDHIPHLAATTPHDPYEVSFFKDDFDVEDPAASFAPSANRRVYKYADDHPSAAERYNATLTTPRIELFDRHHARVSESIRQNLEELEEQNAAAPLEAVASSPPPPPRRSAQPAAASEVRNRVAPTPTAQPPRNGSKVALEYTNHVSLQYNLSADPPRSANGDVVLENGTHVDFTSSYIHSEIFPDDVTTQPTVEQKRTNVIQTPQETKARSNETDDQSVGSARVVESVKEPLRINSAEDAENVVVNTTSPTPPANKTNRNRVTPGDIQSTTRRATSRSQQTTEVAPTTMIPNDVISTVVPTKANRTRYSAKRLKISAFTTTDGSAAEAAGATTPATASTAGSVRARTRARMIASPRAQGNTTNSVEEAPTAPPDAGVAVRPSAAAPRKTTRYSWRRPPTATAAAEEATTATPLDDAPEAMVRVPISTVTPAVSRGPSNATSLRRPLRRPTNATEPSTASTPTPTPNAAAVRRYQMLRRRLPISTEAPADEGTEAAAAEVATAAAAPVQGARRPGPVARKPTAPFRRPTIASRERGSVRFGAAEEDDDGGMSIPPTAAAWLLATLHGPAEGAARPAPRPAPEDQQAEDPPAPTTTETPVLSSPTEPATTPLPPLDAGATDSGAAEGRLPAPTAPAPTAELGSHSGEALDVATPTAPAPPPTPTHAGETDAADSNPTAQVPPAIVTLSGGVESGPAPDTTDAPTPTPTPTPGPEDATQPSTTESSETLAAEGGERATAASVMDVDFVPLASTQTSAPPADDQVTTTTAPAPLPDDPSGSTPPTALPPATPPTTTTESAGAATAASAPARDPAATTTPLAADADTPTTTDAAPLPTVTPPPGDAGGAGTAAAEVTTVEPATEKTTAGAAAVGMASADGGESGARTEAPAPAPGTPTALPEDTATTATTLPAPGDGEPTSEAPASAPAAPAVAPAPGSAAVNAYIVITVQASWEALCRDREAFRGALAHMAVERFGKNVTVVVAGMGSGAGAAECERMHVDSTGETRLLTVTVYLLDERGFFSKELVESFYMLVSQQQQPSPLQINRVELVYGPLPTTSSDSNAGVIAAITISCVGAVCLLLLAALLIIMRKRQKRFNYGQRCTPVSLDAYSLDSVSVYDSVRRKGALRASKRSYGNPAFDDPGAPSHPMNFAGLANFSSDRAALEEEFEMVPQVTPKSDELPEGAETKNRYSNVIPLPETRVHLSLIDGEPLSDYINANYVKGPKNENKFYIACQAPLPSTVTDFWRMIWEQQSKAILMLTDLVENGVEKCADYLPPSEVLDCHRLFGDFQITLKKREEREKYIISTLQLKNLETNSWREVTHLWYINWPHQGVPDESNSIIAFLIEARPYMRSNSGPTVVHCSPGTGRTGTVLACDICIRDFEQTRMVDIPRCVYQLRRDRAGAVKTKDQYVFIYQVLNTYATKLTGGGGSLDSI